MSIEETVSSGIEQLDEQLSSLRIGDNVVWEVDAGTYIDFFVDRFVYHTLWKKCNVVYVSFNKSPMTLTKRFHDFPNHEHFTLIDCFTSGKGNNDETFLKFYDTEAKNINMKVTRLDEPKDIESFKAEINKIEEEKNGTRFVFDSLTGMQDLWGDETRTYKFFTYSCPRLYDLRTVAYWIIEKDAHSKEFRANLKHVTQVVIDLSNQEDILLLKITKAESRNSLNLYQQKSYEIFEGSIDFPSLKEEKLEIGRKIKMLRTEKGLSQKDVADAVNVTPSFISQLERELLSPSLDTLLKIGRFLKTEPAAFFEKDKTQQNDDFIFRKNQRKPTFLHFRNGKLKCVPLLKNNTTKPKKLFAQIIYFESHKVLESHFHPFKGEELGVVLKGEIEVDIANKKHTLKEGDSIYLDFVLPRRWRNTGETETQVMWVAANH